MSIDWITVAAQIVNFLVLVLLLRRFLYRPILDGIDAREAEIAARMGEAEEVKAAADAAKAEHEAAIAALAKSRDAAIEEGRARARAAQDAMLAQTREQLEHERVARQKQRAEEAKRYAAELEQSGAAAILALVRKALHDLSDETLEERIIAHAVPQLAEKAGVLADAAQGASVAVVTTREKLPDRLKRRIKAEIVRAMPGIAMRFTTDRDRAPGLNLRVGGARLGWTVDTYMDGLETVLQETRTGRSHAA